MNSNPVTNTPKDKARVGNRKNAVAEPLKEKVQHPGAAMMNSNPVTNTPKDKARVGNRKNAVAEPLKEKAQVLVPNQCIACYTCGGGFNQKVASLITGNWLEYGSECGGDQSISASDYPDICCLVSSEGLAVHV